MIPDLRGYQPGCPPEEFDLTLSSIDSHLFRGFLWKRLLKIVVLTFSGWILLSYRNTGSEFSLL